MDKVSKGDNYYIKPAKHQGTYKVEFIGADKKKGTKDDINIADFTTMPNPLPPTTKIEGILYRKLSAEKKAKVKALKDESQEFRWKKDQEDYNRISLAEWEKNPSQSAVKQIKKAVQF